MTSISDTTAHLIDSLQAKLAKALDEKDAAINEAYQLRLRVHQLERTIKTMCDTPFTDPNRKNRQSR